MHFFHFAGSGDIANCGQVEVVLPVMMKYLPEENRRASEG